MKRDEPREDGWRERAHTVIFGSDTPAGKAFDVVLIAAILARRINPWIARRWICPGAPHGGEMGAVVVLGVAKDRV